MRVRHCRASGGGLFGAVPARPAAPPYCAARQASVSLASGRGRRACLQVGRINDADPSTVPGLKADALPAPPKRHDAVAPSAAGTNADPSRMAGAPP